MAQGKWKKPSSVSSGDTFKEANKCVTGILGGRIEETVKKFFEEIMGENFPKFMKTLKPQIQELQWKSSIKKHEENYPKAYHNQIAQKKWWKQPEKRDILN